MTTVQSELLSIEHQLRGMANELAVLRKEHNRPTLEKIEPERLRQALDEVVRLSESIDAIVKATREVIRGLQP